MWSGCRNTFSVWFLCTGALKDVANCRVGRHWVRRRTASSLTQRDCSYCQECSCRKLNISDGGWLVSWIHNFKKDFASVGIVMLRMFTVKEDKSTALNTCKSCKLLSVTCLSRLFINCLVDQLFMFVYCRIKLTFQNVRKNYSSVIVRK